ncbi:2-succinyl-5-enolpyruvyl-6-hydroxy-3-cyclohexene-1-carboxylic-acid synthase [Actinoalloteichus spitiensis]|uniref:2-succinyl-5-enolpyruvyl-6-hydroxy-3- cyclohexene-1-carboxylic-acid synthase n=1 Tax=Actinoalloteichus spitiensis TaxID=252394 RepID=UPI000373E927|nr:2-succinyl-5-enolpyruvyl-6-hydroxy-3-cyclohexene-1-carboxylic-acid synthase [Actinoalloteichus spitiensis]
MNPSTAQAEVIVDELIRNGMRHVVLCPGSRNAPLAYALHDAAEAGRVALHVRVDERSAAFLALGISKGLNARHTRTGFAAVVCTSGTAAGNMQPAMMEAHHAGEPLLVVTADRPPELLGTGANQTTMQHGLFGPLVSTTSFPPAERRAGQNAVWRSLLCRAVVPLHAGGPAHLNIPFREPLVPHRPERDQPEWPESLAGRPDGGAWTVTLGPQSAHGAGGGAALAGLSPRTLVVAGEGPVAVLDGVAALAKRVNWPLVAEPSANAGMAPTLVGHGMLLLNSGELPERLRPDAVLVVGRPTLSRGVQRLLRAAGTVHMVADPENWPDPQYVARRVCPGLDDTDLDGPAGHALVSQADPEWFAAWRDAGAATAAAVTGFLAAEEWPTGLHVARDLVDAAGPESVVFLGSSNPIRDVDLVAGGGERPLTLANRGLAGIDGAVSTAAGVVLGAATRHDGPPRGYALLGDLTFLHDINGLLIGPAERRPDLTLVVVNDDGGGIFELLEQGEPGSRHGFERVFGTPHGADLGALCAGYGVPYVRVRDREEFVAALAAVDGLQVVEVRVDRGRLRDLHDRLRAAVRHALSGA